MARQQLNVRIPGPLRDEVDATATEQGISQSDLVIAALHRFLAELRTRRQVADREIGEMFHADSTAGPSSPGA